MNKTDASATVALTFDDGATTHVTQWGSGGPALLCVHGMTSSRYSWTRFAQRFADRYRVFAYDQRGHGDSGHVHGPMALDRADADLRAVRETIEGPVFSLIGHSWGGAVVLRGGRTTRVQRVIAVDPMISVPGDFDWHYEYISDLESDKKLSPDELTREYETRYAKAGWAREDIDAKFHAVKDMTIESLERLGTENNAQAGGWDLREIVKDYPKPLLLCLAEPDESTVTAQERVWLEQNAGPNVTQILYEGQDHNLHRTDFNRFANDIDRWLSQH